MATKAIDRTTAIIADAIAIAERKLELEASEGNLAQRIAALYKAKKCFDRDDDAYKAIRKMLRDAMDAKLEGKSDALVQKAKRTLDVQMSYGMNILTGTNREGAPCNEKTGRPIPQEKGAHTGGVKAAKRDKPEAAVQQYEVKVTREAAYALVGKELGEELIELVMFCAANKEVMLPKLKVLVESVKKAESDNLAGIKKLKQAA